jgi:hypothetical protein
LRGWRWERLQCFEDSTNARNLVGAEQIGFAKGGKSGEERLSGADFVAEILEGVGKCVADGEPEGAESEGMEEGAHLVLDADGAVLKIAVIEAKAGINEDAIEVAAQGEVDLAGEVILHAVDGIGTEIEGAHLTHILPLDITDDDGGVVVGRQAIDGFRADGACEVQDVGARFEAGLGNRGLVGLHRNKNVCLAQGANDGQKRAGLHRVVESGGMREGGFGADIDDLRALCGEGDATLDGGVRAEADTFAVPGVGGEIDHAEDCGSGLERERASVDVELTDHGLACGLVLVKKIGEVFERQHGGKGSGKRVKGKGGRWAIPDDSDRRDEGDRDRWHARRDSNAGPSA